MQSQQNSYQTPRGAASSLLEQEHASIDHHHQVDEPANTIASNQWNFRCSIHWLLITSTHPSDSRPPLQIFPVGFLRRQEKPSTEVFHLREDLGFGLR